MHHAVKAVEIARGQRSHIADDLAIRLWHRLPAAPREQVEIAADNVMPGRLQQPHEMSADITPMAGHQNLHVILTPESSIGCAGPGSLSRLPQARQVFVVALGVHASPKGPVLEYRQLAVASQTRQRIAFEHAIFGWRQVSVE